MFGVTLFVFGAIVIAMGFPVLLASFVGPKPNKVGVYALFALAIGGMLMGFGLALGGLQGFGFTCGWSTAPLWHMRWPMMGWPR